MLPTESHEIFNSVPALQSYNAYQIDVAFKDHCHTHYAPDNIMILNDYGNLVGNEYIDLARLANLYPPVLHNYDTFGQRIDWIEYHPAYHALLEKAISFGLHCLPWEKTANARSHSLRASLLYLHGQAEAGTCCPLSMSFAAYPLLTLLEDKLKTSFLPKLTARFYQPQNIPYFAKKGLSFGMSMTEKQGGSDIKANTTFAQKSTTEDSAYLLNGHKWFCSAPMSDAFFVTAQTADGMGCFLLPRWLPDGTQNRMYIQRLKDKLGNRSNASSEIELKNAEAFLVGTPGEGIKNIITMVTLTRFDCIIGSAALMRQALVQATHHALHRHAFGKKLFEQPLIQNILADLQLEMEAMLAFIFRLSSALDNSHHPAEKSLARLLTTIGKYWFCKSAPGFVNEAQEMLGGLGFIESSLMPRLYKEAPLNAIWEGCGNIQCLDLMRIQLKSLDIFEYLFDELSIALGNCHLFDAYLLKTKKKIFQTPAEEIEARQIMEELSLLVSAALLMKQGNSMISSSFNQSRLSDSARRFYGTLSKNIDCFKITQRIITYERRS